MNKLLIGILMVFAWASVQADDLKVADDFESGDLVSAETFNQIFDTLEKINRTVVDTDLVGVWSCSAVHISSSLDATGWTQKGFLYELTGAQVNFTASSASTSLESAYSFTTSNPSPFYRRGTNTSETGTYILYKGMLLMKGVGSTTNIEPYKVEIVSNTRVIFTPLGDGGNNPESIVCDSATAVPAAPTSPTVTNNKTNLELAWTDGSSDETGFKVYRKLSTESEAKLVATQTAATYSDTDLTEGQTAYYHVTAYNDNGESAKTKTVSATLDSVPPTVVAVSPADGTAFSTTFANISAPIQGSWDQTSVTVTITFSEEVVGVCSATNEMGQCDDKLTGGVYGNDQVDGALAIAIARGGLNNSGKGFLGASSTGTTFTFQVPINIWNSSSAITGDNSATLNLTIRSAKIKDINGNSLGADYTWSFSITDPDGN